MNTQNLRLFQTLIIFSFMLFSGTAFSNEKEKKPALPKVFSIHDLDKDGYLSKNEYQAFIEKKSRRNRQNKRQKSRTVKPFSFEEIDLNTDGKISLDEMILTISKRHKNKQKKNQKAKN